MDRLNKSTAMSTTSHKSYLPKSSSYTSGMTISRQVAGNITQNSALQGAFYPRLQNSQTDLTKLNFKQNQMRMGSQLAICSTSHSKSQHNSIISQSKRGIFKKNVTKPGQPKQQSFKIRTSDNQSQSLGNRMLQYLYGQNEQIDEETKNSQQSTQYYQPQENEEVQSPFKRYSQVNYQMIAQNAFIYQKCQLQSIAPQVSATHTRDEEDDINLYPHAQDIVEELDIPFIIPDQIDFQAIERKQTMTRKQKEQKIKKELFPKLLRNIFQKKVQVHFKDLKVNSLTYKREKEVKRTLKLFSFATLLDRKFSNQLSKGFTKIKFCKQEQQLSQSAITEKKFIGSYKKITRRRTMKRERINTKSKTLDNQDIAPSQAQIEMKQSLKQQAKEQRKTLHKMDERIKTILGYYFHQWRLMSKINTSSIVNHSKLSDTQEKSQVQLNDQFMHQVRQVKIDIDSLNPQPEFITEYEIQKEDEIDSQIDDFQAITEESQEESEFIQQQRQNVLLSDPELGFCDDLNISKIEQNNVNFMLNTSLADEFQEICPFTAQDENLLLIKSPKARTPNMLFLDNQTHNKRDSHEPNIQLLDNLKRTELENQEVDSILSNQLSVELSDEESYDSQDGQGYEYSEESESISDQSTNLNKMNDLQAEIEQILADFKKKPKWETKETKDAPSKTDDFELHLNLDSDNTKIMNLSPLPDLTAINDYESRQPQSEVKKVDETNQLYSNLNKYEMRLDELDAMQHDQTIHQALNTSRSENTQRIQQRLRLDSKQSISSSQQKFWQNIDHQPLNLNDSFDRDNDFNHV